MTTSHVSDTAPTLRLTVLIGSVREGRFGPVAADWAVQQAEAHGRFKIRLVDLADTELPLALGPTPPAVATEDERPVGLAPLTDALREADAYLVVTPEYNRSFPASLKAAIDWHYGEWRAKPVAFVSYGATFGGALAVEQLRQVYGELHTVTVRDTVSFPRYWTMLDEAGQLDVPAETRAEATAMFDELAWWGEALAQARAAAPYPGG
ncbi:NAD(P)H-dependent oxidoreductase [Streptomyces sp. DSM 44915]|uniref:NAD(P)H-dependent oxidoreductase n=1 Tax=Streptomyces chisholmiae TaxID=3075540 RepID=A0ABU2JZY1_9ACTN|nr:NAD(P)H-dependent oxidoreductase [Streptomyces sp. DSM 44915]MDT0270500.1 NAD(P)H-dependent oxidoreductase [Streptomyces sp. DSM 44915]